MDKDHLRATAFVPFRIEMDPDHPMVVAFLKLSERECDQILTNLIIKTLEPVLDELNEGDSWCRIALDYQDVRE